MSESARSPLLGPSSSSSQRAPSKISSRSTRSVPSDETTPLLSREEDEQISDGEQANITEESTALASPEDRPQKKSTRRWPSVVALSVLSVVVIAGLCIGFFAPAVVEEYATQAAVFEPKKLSIHSLTSTGVQARVQGVFVMDASRVKKDAVRNIGRAGTWIAKAVESQESTVKVYLPEYGDILIGTAVVPRIIVNIRNGHSTDVDFLTHLKPGNVDGIRKLANDWIEGRLGQLRVQGKVDVGLKSGIFPLGVQSISESLVFEGHDLPAIPEYNITKFNVHEAKGEKGMTAEASLSLFNQFPVQLTVPPLGFKILVPNCLPLDPNIMLADATTEMINIEPKTNVEVNVSGIVRELPDVLTKDCPNSHSSPLDILLGEYIRGAKTTIFVQGAESPSPETPEWIGELMKSVTVPVPFPGHTFDSLIKNFSLADVHFSLPNPVAEPGTPESQPRLSAIVKALVALPKEMNFAIDVSRVRADADVFYHGKKLGNLDLKKWQRGNSTRQEAKGNGKPMLLVESIVKDAPLDIIDDDVFSDVISELLLGGKGVQLGIKAEVDVEAETALGQFVIKKIPAEGKIAIKPIPGGGFGSLSPKVGSLKILETTEKTLTLEARVNFTNPTEYSAYAPYVNIHILNNNTLLGHATAQNVYVSPGKNDNILVQALWDPSALGGKNGSSVGRELLSQYVSGWNTTLTLKTHNGTIPSQPALGAALSALNVEIPTPRLHTPNRPGGGDGDSDDEDKPHFIEGATMHLLSSTADFVLLSPLPHTAMFITRINATAFYNHTEPVGKIIYDLPFKVPPGESETPRLPVEWSLGSVGYEAVKSALGGTLRLDAAAVVGLKVDKWKQEIWYIGHGIGANVKL